MVLDVDPPVLAHSPTKPAPPPLPSPKKFVPSKKTASGAPVRAPLVASPPPPSAPRVRVEEEAEEQEAIGTLSERCLEDLNALYGDDGDLMMAFCDPENFVVRAPSQKEPNLVAAFRRCAFCQQDVEVSERAVDSDPAAVSRAELRTTALEEHFDKCSQRPRMLNNSNHDNGENALDHALHYAPKRLSWEGE